LLGESLDNLESLVKKSLEEMIGNGGLSGDTAADVDTWDVTIVQK